MQILDLHPRISKVFVRLLNFSHSRSEPFWKKSPFSKKINKNYRVVASLNIMGPLTLGRLSEITLRIIFRCSFCWLLPTMRTSPSAAQEYNFPKLSMIMAMSGFLKKKDNNLDLFFLINQKMLMSYQV